MVNEKDKRNRFISINRKAKYNYHINDKYEAGVILLGSEVKSLRMGHGNLAESYAQEEDGEIWIRNFHISDYQPATIVKHEPERPRKLLLKKKEIGKILGAIKKQGMTIIPLSIYFNNRGIAKIEIGIAKGKKLYDKRQDIKSRDWQKNKARILRAKNN
ncbi:MAG: SsrA-binding protein [Rhodospirillaceae bacterium]|nr:SsrA-binding protein [Rhodospirillaceae bacterium]|tara:strand:- start:15 stop:491 length:477 start_codon:yes stop_codon:yes gene_type:complete